MKPVLASSLKIEYPLNNALPSTDHARDRLLARIFTYRRNDRAVRTVSDEDFALLYAYGEKCSSLLALFANIWAF